MEQTVYAFIMPLIPLLVAFFLPRRKTVEFGSKIFGLSKIFLFQKSNKFINNVGLINSLINLISTTFVDFSFGVFLGSKNWDPDIKQKLIEDYFNGTDINLKNKSTKTNVAIKKIVKRSKTKKEEV